MIEDYVPPRNALTELVLVLVLVLVLILTPDMIKATRGPLAEIRDQNPTGDWPEEPYHYGMVRDIAYERWLTQRSEKDIKEEISACRAR